MMKTVLLTALLWPFFTYGNPGGGKFQPEPMGPCPGMTITMSSTSVLCNGGNTGAAQVAVTSPNEPLTYLWNDPSATTTAAVTGLTAGSYMVIITDSTGCSDSGFVTVTQPPALSLAASVTPVACPGGSNGSIDLSVSGGTPNYTYNWLGGPSTQDRSNLSTGTYTVIVTDNNGCNDTLTALVGTPSNFNVSSIITDATCAGGSNGSVDITISGATPPYTYSWSNGATSQDLTGVAAGTYNVTITDNNGCTFIMAATVDEPDPVSISSVVTHVSCTGGTNGAIDASVVGGTAPYTYSWSTGSTTQDINGLSPGPYTLTVTDVNGCTGAATINVNAAGPLTLNFAVTQITCNGAANGMINLTPNGGTAPYTFSWSTGALTEDISNLAPGTYNVTVTDAAGCTTTGSVTITQPAALSLSHNVTTVQCFGQSTGAIDLSISGGVTPYSYSWSNGATTQDITGLNAGTYTVTVTDNAGCTSVISIPVIQPAALSVSSSLTHISCNGGGNGAVNLLVSGGTTPYTYSWSNGSTTEDISSLTSGSYSVTVTDANGCTSTHSVTLTQPGALILSTTVSDATCSGITNGSIDLVISGGTGPFTYAWSNGSTSEDISSLSAGSYSVTVTDSKGCTATTTASVSAPSAMSLTISSTPSNCGASTGSATVTVSGGNAPYSYVWSPGGQTGSTATGLSAGTYSVIVSDNNGCVNSTSVSVGSASGLAATLAVTNAQCSGTSTGSIDLTITGGTSPFTYSWSNGATSQDIASLSSGTYAVTVTDANGCSYFTSAVVNQPSVIILNTTVTNPTCNGSTDGSVDLSVSGGTAPYTYAWSNGPATQDVNALSSGSYSVMVTDANGCTSPVTVNLMNPPVLNTTVFSANVNCNGVADGQIDINVTGGVAPYTYLWNTGATTQDLTGLTAGSYNVTITDNAGCVTTASATITQPAPLGVSYIASNILCEGAGNGFIDLSVTGGTAPYTYSWTNGATSQDIGGISGGVFTVQVNDNNNCQSVLTINIAEPLPLTSAVSATSSTCGNPDGTATVTVNGGTAPYTYLWNDPALQTTATAVNLTGGSYGVTVSDANGCQHSTSVAVGMIGGPAVTAVATDVTCFGVNNGMVNLTVTGGTAPYSFNWSNTDQTEDIDSLSSGFYFVTVSDANGCTDTLTAFIDEPTQLVLSGTVTNNNCSGASLGMIDVTVSGGTLPYDFSWSPGNMNTEDIMGLQAGTYFLTMEDGNGCLMTDSFEVMALSSPIVLTTSSTPEKCPGETDGSARVVVSGGTSPYTFQWSNGDNTSATDNLSAGTYTVIVTDLNGCQQLDQIEVRLDKESCDSLFIPSAFSPNGDGTNDIWTIRNISLYSTAVVQVFNRWGSEVFSSNGYAVPWDGTYHGQPLPPATYYYVIKLNDVLDPVTGTITIVR